MTNGIAVAAATPCAPVCPRSSPSVASARAGSRGRWRRGEGSAAASDAR
ncbi:MAG: hypothetical protein ACLTDR_05865 [Adlercreutzia equolifaciens]